MKKQALKELARGRPVGAVCSKYDVSPKTLQQWKQTVSLNEGSPGKRGRVPMEISDEKKLAIAQAYERGDRGADILAKYKVPIHRMYEILTELGINMRRSRKEKTSITSVREESVTVQDTVQAAPTVQPPTESHPLHRYIQSEIMRDMEIRLLKNENSTLRAMYCELRAENMELTRQKKKGA